MRGEVGRNGIYHRSSRLLWGFLAWGLLLPWSKTNYCREVTEKACVQKKKPQRGLSGWEDRGQQRGCCNSRKHPQRTRSSLPGRFGQLWSGCCSWSLPGAHPNGRPLRTSCWGPMPGPRWHHRLGVPPGSLPSPQGVVLIVWSVSPQTPGMSRKGRTGWKDWSGVGLSLALTLWLEWMVCIQVVRSVYTERP